MMQHIAVPYRLDNIDGICRIQILGGPRLIYSNLDDASFRWAV